MRQFALKLEKPFLWLVLSVMAAAVATHTVFQGNDFEVFWKAARNFHLGEPIYSVARDGAMVFKYPPWSVPILWPLGWFSFYVAQWFWGIGQVVCIAYLMRWCVLGGSTGWRTVGWITALYWGIWAVHAMDGQINLLMITGVFFASSTVLKHRWGLLMSVWCLSIKVFSLVGLPSWTEGKRLRVRDVVLVAAVLFGLGMTVTIRSNEGVIGTYKAWMTAASSGGEQLSGKVRGRENQGLPALVLRAFGVPPQNSRADLWVFALVATGVGWGWRYFSKSLSQNERRAGWLAFAAAVHPLAWFHLFVWTFPFAVLVVGRCWSGRASWTVRLGSVVGVLLITAVTRKTLGPYGEALELMSVKSWGVVLLAGTLLMRTRTRDDARS